MNCIELLCTILLASDLLHYYELNRIMEMFCLIVILYNLYKSHKDD